MADGGHFEKRKFKSPYLRNRSTNFDEIWPGHAYWPVTANLPLKFRIFDNPRWLPPSSYHKNRNTSTEIWLAVAKLVS